MRPGSRLRCSSCREAGCGGFDQPGIGGCIVAACRWCDMATCVGGRGQGVAAIVPHFAFTALAALPVASTAAAAVVVTGCFIALRWRNTLAFAVLRRCVAGIGACFSGCIQVCGRCSFVTATSATTPAAAAALFIAVDFDGFAVLTQRQTIGWQIGKGGGMLGSVVTRLAFRARRTLRDLRGTCFASLQRTLVAA